MFRTKLLLAAGCAVVAFAAPACAQEAGDAYVRVSAARTKLADKGVVYENGVKSPDAGYTTREAYHSVVTLGYFPVDDFSVEASLSTPATSNNLPGGSLAGLPNLGDDEYMDATLGATFAPFKGHVRPYVGGGLALHFTTQVRDALAVGFNVSNASGPYANAGVAVDVTKRIELFADVRKAWYSTKASGKLPLDATYTKFAQVDATAKLDPLTIQLGIGARFGASTGADEGDALDLSTPDTSKWLVKVGLTNLRLADGVDLKVAGAPYPGTALSTFEHQTPTLQLTRFFTQNIAANLTVGVPPSISIYGAGTIGAVPKLGKVTYGPATMTLQYHPWRQGLFRPYVGVGAAYMIVFGTKDGAFQNLKVGDDVAWAFEAGTHVMVQSRVSLFVDLKKALLRPSTYGTFNGMAVEGKTRLDPWAATGGMAFHF